MAPNPLPAATQHAIEEGLRRYAGGLFWEAHEAWEDAWLVEEGDVKLGLQGLIQLTAAFHKGHRMNNPRAMRTLLVASIEKLEHVALSHPCFAGIDVPVLLHALRDIAGRTDARDAPDALPDPPVIPRCA
jgi:hypothetical protein